MNKYICGRLRADASHLVERGEAEQLIVHRGLRGRFRELLVDAILTPWLPPLAVCGTGMIVDVEDRIREATQEDVVVFDRSIVPPVLAHSTTMEGVFPLDGVLARIEVKSKLTRTELRKAVQAAAEITYMKFAPPSSRSSMLPLSSIFAFGSDLTGPPEAELERLLSVVNELGLHYQGSCPDYPGPISSLCIVGRGSWGFGSEEGTSARWVQARMVEKHDEILHFIGVMSNTCFAMHNDRTGVLQDPARGAGGGIGCFIMTADTFEVSPIQHPPILRGIQIGEASGYTPL